MNLKPTKNSKTISLKQLSNNLISYFKVGSWWPGITKDEIIIGAVLTQNTSWKNVESSLNNLKKNNLINIKKLYSLNQNYLIELIKPSGFYKQKSHTLIELSKHINKYHSLDNFF
ncbi:MAG: hypothetical protein QXD23_01005, partial [Candidatus Micrarchaeaceae archaeon]